MDTDDIKLYDDDEYRCCICQETVIPEDEDTGVDSDGNFYCDVHLWILAKREGGENQ